MECIYMYMGASIDTAENTELVATRIMDDGSSKVFLMLGVGLGVGLRKLFQE